MLHAAAAPGKGCHPRTRRAEASWIMSGLRDGELAGNRTQDPRLKRALLYQLSYELAQQCYFQTNTAADSAHGREGMWLGRDIACSPENQSHNRGHWKSLELSAPQRLLHRHHLHGDVADLVEEAIEHRAAQQDVPARAGRLAEDDVRDILLLSEADQGV